MFCTGSWFRDLPAGDQTLLKEMYRLHITINQLECEVAVLQDEKERLDKQLFLEENAVQTAEEWLRENEGIFSHFEEITDEAENKLLQSAQCLSNVKAEIQELESCKAAASYEVTHLLAVRDELQQNLQVTSEEEGELETISLGEVIILEETNSEEDQENTGGILEEAVTEEEPVQGQTSMAPRRKKCKSCGCFSFLWSWFRK